MFNKEYVNFIKKHKPEFSSNEEGEVPLSNIEVINNDKNEQEIIISEGDNSLSLNNFLPDGVHFKGTPDEVFHFSRDYFSSAPWRNDYQDNVFFPLDKINDFNGRLDLLHEIGHARNFYAGQDKNEFFVRAIVQSVNISIKNSEEYKKITDSEDQKRYFKNEFKKSWKEEVRKIPNFQYKDANQAIESIAKDERNAWAEGVKLYLKIKNENKIDLLGNASQEKIFKHAYYCLSAYEKEWSAIIDDQKKPFDLKKFIKETLGISA